MLDGCTLNLDIVEECTSEIQNALLAIQQPRTDFELEHFVVGQHDTEPRRFAQCVLEMQLKIHAIRRAQVNSRKKTRELERLLSDGSPDSVDDAEMLRIDLEEQSLAIIGAQRELSSLLKLFRRFSRSYSRDELNASEQAYWTLRLYRQANQEIAAYGRVGVGNQDALRQIGLSVGTEPNFVAAVEQRFLSQNDTRIVVVVPTLIPRDQISKQGLECLTGWSIPGSFRICVHVVDGRSVAAAYTAGVRFALKQNADFVLCVEDDHIISEGSFERLWNCYETEGPQAIVGGWYPQKKSPRTGAAIVLKNGRREYLEADGRRHDVYGITQGFTLIPSRVFREIPEPWFVTTDSLTQDAFFSQLAREAGYRLVVDTSVRCSHRDRENGRIYE